METPRGGIGLLWRRTRSTFDAWLAHDAPRLGASLAFYSLLSLAPVVIVAIAIAAAVLGDSNSHQRLVDEVKAQFSSMIGPAGAQAVGEILTQAHQPARGVVASLIAFLTLLLGASGVFGELREALNRMWDVKPPAVHGVIAFLRERLFSFGMVLTVGFLLLISLTASAALATIGKFFSGVLPLPPAALDAIDVVVSLAGISALFALIFRYVPQLRIRRRSLWTGSAVTAVLFVLGKYAIALYLGKAAVGSAYGAAGSLVAVIVWVYYSSMIFLFGAEYTHILDQEAAAGTAR